MKRRNQFLIWINAHNRKFFEAKWKQIERGKYAMGFLDATGLGTFWGKLKNYFIPKTSFQGPVSEDLKDIIVPINLWKNSEFINMSIERGLDFTLNFDVVDGTTKYINNALNIHSSGVTATLQTVFSGRKLTISGTVTSLDASKEKSLTVRNTDTTVEGNIYYSYSGNVAINSPYITAAIGPWATNESVVRVLADQTSSIAYKICSITSAANPCFTIYFSEDIPSNFEFSIELTHPMVCCGKIINPEYVPSTEYAGGSFGIPLVTLRQLSGALGYSSIFKNNVGWHRIMKLVAVDTTVGPNLALKAFISKGLGASQYERYFLTAAISIRGPVGYLSCDSFKGAGGMAISKFRIVYVTDDGYYLEAYISQSGQDTYNFYLESLYDNANLPKLILQFDTNLKRTPYSYINRIYNNIIWGTDDAQTAYPDNEGTVIKEITTSDKFFS